MCRIGYAQATRLVHVARSLAAMPRTRDALADGDVPEASATVLMRAREARPDAFGEMEATLVDAARTLPVRELRYAVMYWQQAVDPSVAEAEAERRFDRRRLHVSPTLDGMVRVDGDLDPETGQTVMTALRSMADHGARDPEDARTPAQRRADALGELCRRWLDSGDRPMAGGERPHVTVTVDLEALERRTGTRCELDDVGPITPETARRLACDAAISRVITRGRSEPLEVGRRSPVVPGPLRRAVALRDRGCTFPGCDRPRSWCDAHHVVHWADGGPTSLSNLVLLCRPHHRMVHTGAPLMAADRAPP
ncbi:MAG TPA: DUF222 domain-containing protein [Actinomycetota bacterium]